MPVPDYQTMMLPLLEELSDGREQSAKDLRERLAQRFGLTEAERAQLLPSGHQSAFDNRFGWAKTYLDKAGLLETVRRGIYRISDRGRAELAKKPNRIDNRFLARFPEWESFIGGAESEAGEVAGAPREQPTPAAGLTPDEQLKAAYDALRKKTEAELVKEAVKGSPDLFERIVVQLLLKMGYGGVHGRGHVVGKVGDGGVDGVIHQDALGLERIYVQAKRWQSSVGPDVVRAFAGTLGEQGAMKGVILTTSTFTAAAKQFAERSDKQIVLVDGQRLGELMFHFSLGVADKEVYVVKKLDTDFFQGEL